MTAEELKPKSPEERNNLDLLELVCQLHYRALAYPSSKEIHEAYIRARQELEKRLQDRESYAKQVAKERAIEDRLKMLKQIGEYIWEHSLNDTEASLAFGYNKNGLPDSVSLEICGRTHSEFTLI